MGSIVVFHKDEFREKDELNCNPMVKQKARIAGMAELGRRFDAARKAGLLAKTVVDTVITGLLADGHRIECDGGVVERRGRWLSYEKDGVRYRLILEAQPDARDAEGKVHRMKVAVPRGAESILDPNLGTSSYLRTVAEDIQAVCDKDDPDYKLRKAYLLGTITFRRCRD